ncbi:hypothetical protein BD289DRAFT_281118 [Coniella lustricola]|uniref:Uncharacterized protein n=1 Tax=Coniella lustricola TaxID=2025994 RepID=A0A2T3A5W2_9PEZI|nr:hypothetical protein BD289DRAFT_281118 [Coniella lustricola]
MRHQSYRSHATIRSPALNRFPRAGPKAAAHTYITFHHSSQLCIAFPPSTTLGLVCCHGRCAPTEPLQLATSDDSLKRLKRSETPAWVSQPNPARSDIVYRVCCRSSESADANTSRDGAAVQHLAAWLLPSPVPTTGPAMPHLHSAGAGGQATHPMRSLQEVLPSIVS